MPTPPLDETITPEVDTGHDEAHEALHAWYNASDTFTPADRALLDATDEPLTTALKDKLDDIEPLADVTDTANVEAAGGGIICRYDSGTGWEARPIGARYGVLFLSTNDAAAPVPTDVNLQVGDRLKRHPSAA